MKMHLFVSPCLITSTTVIDSTRAALLALDMPRHHFTLVCVTELNRAESVCSSKQTWTVNEDKTTAVPVLSLLLLRLL